MRCVRRAATTTRPARRRPRAVADDSGGAAGLRSRYKLDGEHVPGVVGRPLGIEQNVLSSGAIESLSEFDRELQARRQAGKRSSQCRLAGVQVEGESERNLARCQRAPRTAAEIDEVGHGCTGGPGRLAVKDAAAPRGSE